MAKKKAAGKAPAKRTPKKKRAPTKAAKPKPAPADVGELKKRAKRVVRGLAKAYPDVTCALQHRSPYELLVSTILSAQCTDERVNKTTPALFDEYPDFAALANAEQASVEKLIQSTGFFRNKATNIIAMARAVVEEYNGELPTGIDAMIQLPGVGRKTANVVLGTWYGLPTGVVVDTHVKRISNLLGLTASGNPDIIERDLMNILPQKEWINFSHRMIHHGRRICVARRPDCTQCPLLKDCPRTGLPPLE